MTTKKPSTAILHYSAPPVIGGVEGVIEAHAQIFLENQYPIAIIAGKGSPQALPEGVDLHILPMLDTQHELILAAAEQLNVGTVPRNFDALKQQLLEDLGPLLAMYDNLIVHNVFTKHFNLPLTAALVSLIEAGGVANGIAWHHDFTWTSPRSRSKVHDGYPWDLLRSYRPDLRHVTISQERREELVGLYGCDEEDIQVIYNGVDPQQMWGLGQESWGLVQRLDLLNADLIMLMPVRVTRAKNIEFALDVVATLVERGMGIKLLLSGPPDPHDPNSLAYFQSLQQRRDDLGLGEAMHFIFESGPDPQQQYQIPLDVVAELYRVADVMFMPSHQEGFGMPVLEAGLLGTAVAASSSVPAAAEIGREDVLQFGANQSARSLAERLAAWVGNDRRLNLARHTRQNYTWQAIFERQIKPLLK